MVDSGGQYLDGTTDVTRTFHYGTPTEEMIERYTDVLQVLSAPIFRKVTPILAAAPITRMLMLLWWAKYC